MNNGKVVVMSGVPGSGKSFSAAMFAKAHGSDAQVISADHYFHEGKDPRQPYTFDPSKLSEAHAWCFREFTFAVSGGIGLIVVDNTNLQNFEASPYMLAASAFGYEAELCRVLCDPEVAFARQTHGVSRAHFDAMYRGMEVALPWWKTTYVKNA